MAKPRGATTTAINTTPQARVLCRCPVGHQKLMIRIIIQTARDCLGVNAKCKTILISYMILMIRVEGNLHNLDMSLETNSTRCGIAGGSWLIGNDDGPEELHGGATC